MLESLISLVGHYGLLGIFVSMLIENIGIPLPTEGAFLVASHLITQGRYSFWPMYWFIVASHMIGAIVAYGIGRWFKRGLAHRFAKSKKFCEAEKAVRLWYDKYGSITVLATRLIGYVRPWSSLIAGVAEFPFWPFLFWSLIGTLIFVYPTMRISALLVVLWQRSPGAHIFISIGIIVGALAIFAFVRFFRSKPKEKVSGMKDC
ncbi:MAG: DedA family protein [Candidatus Berkelbacteria bacterium]|nr:DedA family protein [Candidatus Berkelbacteria bacterium]MCR4306954.1 DedA family protein [Candidatus Berkelbacteria bacterium]